MSKAAAESIRPQAKRGEPVSIDAMLGSFAMDCIGRIIFSMDMGAIKNPDNEFQRQGDRLVNAVAFAYAGVAPWVMRVLNIGLCNK